MTRRWFFQALAGATAVVGAAKRLVAKPAAKELATLQAGDVIKITISSSVPRNKILFIGADARLWMYVSANSVPKASGVRYEELPAPILWKTSAGE